MIINEKRGCFFETASFFFLINTSEVLKGPSEVLINTSEVLKSPLEVLINTSEVLKGPSEVLKSPLEVLIPTKMEIRRKRA